MYAVLTNRRSGEVSLFDVPQPELQKQGVLVRTHFSVISAGTERATVEMGSKSMLSKAISRPDLVRQVIEYTRQNGIGAAYQKVTSKLDTLATLGYSCAGEVIAVGSEVSGFRVGDRVACAGAGYANHCQVNYVPRNLLALVPANVAMEAAAFTTVGAIAMQGLRQAKIVFGETVAIVGAGLLGVLAIQMARAAGCRVIAIDISPQRVDEARNFGAHLSLLAGDANLQEKVMGFSGYGADAVVLTASSSSAEPVELAAKIARDRGRIVVVGAVGMGVSREHVYRKELSMTLSRSYGPGRYDPAYEEEGHDYPIGFVRWTEQRNMEAFLELVSDGGVDLSPLLGLKYPVEQVQEAYAKLSSGVYTAVLAYPDRTASPLPRPCATERPALSGDIRVGCMGAGSFATGMIFPALRALKQVRFEAVATTSGTSAASAKKAFAFARAETPGELLVDPHVDAVFVLSRHDSHAEYVKRALDAGKAVYVEKPLATTAEELKSIEDLVAERAATGRDAFVMVGYNRRFAPLTIKLREFFAGRQEAMMIQIRVNAGYIPKDHWTHRHGGRIVGEFCHFVDWARSVTGSPIVSVSASALPDGARYSGDNVAATLTFEDGSIAIIQYLANGDRSVPKESYEVFCGGRVARLDNFNSLLLTNGGKTETAKAKADKGHRREMELTLNAIRNGSSSPIPFSELLEIGTATFLVHESIRSAKTLQIAQAAPEPDSESAVCIQ